MIVTFAESVQEDLAGWIDSLNSWAHNTFGSEAVSSDAVTASVDECDEYQWTYSRSIDRYAREQPDDPDVPVMLERSRKLRDAYLRWGRDTLGFAAYLFYRPGARVG